VTVFVDTSALYALVDGGDRFHDAALERLAALRGQDLVTHAYVAVELLALLGRRLPWNASEQLVDVLLPLVTVDAVPWSVHSTALAAYRESRLTGVSFVDHTSFAFMRSRALVAAFAYDPDFEARGFELRQ
jgi:predicted nucleic acid-binding protein